MKRDRTDVLRSITALLGEVNRVSRAMHPVAPKRPESKPEPIRVQEGLVSSPEIAAVTDALVRCGAVTVNGVDRRSLEAIVAKTLNTSIQKWMDKSLKHVVDEVVEQQLAKLENQNRRVG
jgi:cell pole-organizing protein PopZ